MQGSDWSLYVMSLFAWCCFTVVIRNNHDQDQNSRLIFAVLLQLPDSHLVCSSGAVYAVRMQYCVLQTCADSVFARTARN